MQAARTGTAENIRDKTATDARTLVYLDLTHLGRHVTGIERVTIEQFERVAFRGAEVRAVRSRGILSMIFRQQVLLPLLALLHPRALFVFPGFPPSPLFCFVRERVVLYVHDLFLLTRKQDLGLKARLYMAWPFGVAVRGLKHFLVNSEKTQAELAPSVAADASITLYRPTVRNVFGLSAQGRDTRDPATRPLKLVALGTLEPRKNYAAAIAISEALARRLPGGAELHVAGREGWGDAAARLSASPAVRLHGYLSANDIRRLLEDGDLYLSTSHDEGLGLPLLEAQYAGLPIVAPDAPVFREVLGTSGIFVNPDDPEAAAQRIADLLATPGWRATLAKASLANVARWNAAAERDGAAIRGIFEAAPGPAIEPAPRVAAP